MKFHKEYYIAISIMGICVIISAILTGTLFIGGTKGIEYGSAKPGNYSSPLLNHLLLFIGETSGFATNHHIDNFLFVFLFTSSTIFIPVYFNVEWKNSKIKRNIYIYLYFIIFLSQVSFAAFWEYYEKILIWVGGIVSFILPTSEYFKSFLSGQENEMNAWLSDMTQAKTASILVILFIVFDVVKPVSYNLFYRKFYHLVIRFLLYAASASTMLLTFVTKEYTGINYRFNIGFYIHVCWRIFFMMALYIDDLRHLKKDESKREINIFWLMIMGYLTFEYISTFDLHSWGLITSNVFGFLYFGICLVIKYAFFERRS